MSDTPETDAAVKESNGQWSFVLKETCQRLERERNKAVEDATNYFARIGELEKERDEAMEALSGRTVSCSACNHAAIERDEAREKAERYRLEANAMMLQRDEAQKHLQDIKEYGTEEINAAVELRQKLAAALHERDEARSLVDHYREQKDLLPISWDV